MKINYGYMRSQAGRNGSHSCRLAKLGWSRKMEKTYKMIEDDGYDSAMLQRFPVLRRAKDEGRDIRTQFYQSQDRPEERNSSKTQSRLDVINLDTELLKEGKKS